MKELLNNPTFVAAVAAVFGGTGVKFIEGWLGRAQERNQENQQLRDDLRKEIDSLREQLDKAAAEELRLEAKVEDWQNKYFDLREEKMKLVTELQILTERLRTIEQRKRDDSDSGK